MKLRAGVEQVLVGYATRVGKVAGYGFITADVADSLEAQPVYELILFTRHRDGLWEMARSMSMARKEWRQWLVDAKAESTGGQVELQGLEFDDNESGWVDEIAANMEAILGREAGFVIENKLGELLGRTLGLARETHIRQALNKIKNNNLIATAPKGELQKAYIARS
jgi:hypothetical protein